MQTQAREILLENSLWIFISYSIFIHACQSNCPIQIWAKCIKFHYKASEVKTMSEAVCTHYGTVQYTHYGTVQYTHYGTVQYTPAL